jgi:hypothetical protein
MELCYQAYECNIKLAKRNNPKRDHKRETRDCNPEANDCDGETALPLSLFQLWKMKRL